jgi:hypothetical protein
MIAAPEKRHQYRDALPMIARFIEQMGCLSREQIHVRLPVKG